MSEMFGRYRIDSVLGEGGMGEVFEAYDTRNERTVALKRLRPGIASSDEYRTRFQRESRAAAGLGSPHVVPIHDVGEIDGRLYIDMRLIRGRDLARTLAATGRLAPARVGVIIGQVADALNSAHEAGLIHRDVKPSNVLLAETGSAQDFAYLVDFGVAKIVDGSGTSLTGTGTALGTMAYMAPEMFMGSATDRRVDVYALACMTHEALTGTPPFTATGPALMYQHLSAEPPRASATQPDLPAAVDDVLLRGMAKDAAARYGTAPEFAAALSKALSTSTAQPTAGSGPVPAQATPPTVSGPSPTTVVGQPVQYASAGGAPPPPYQPGYPIAAPQNAGPAMGHPSGPQGVWPPAPPPGPGLPGGVPGGSGRRRTHPALIVTIAVLAVLVVGLGALYGFSLIGNRSAEPTPSAGPGPTTVAAPTTQAASPNDLVEIPNAPSDIALLRQVFEIGSQCEPVSQAYADSVPLAEMICIDPVNNSSVYYDIWPDVTSARSYFEGVRNGRTSATTDSWAVEGAPQGPFFLGGNTDGKVNCVALYEGKRFSTFIVGPTTADVTSAFGRTASLLVADVPN